MDTYVQRITPDLRDSHKFSTSTSISVTSPSHRNAYFKKEITLNRPLRDGKI